MHGDPVRGELPGVPDIRDPGTTSPYLLATRNTAHTSQPVSEFWLTALFRGLPVTAEQLRDDRIVEEALAGPAGPLHLAAVFGFSPRTGLRYAQAARPGPPQVAAISDGEPARLEGPPGTLLTIVITHRRAVRAQLSKANRIVCHLCSTTCSFRHFSSVPTTSPQSTWRRRIDSPSTVWKSSGGL